MEVRNVIWFMYSYKSDDYADFDEDVESISDEDAIEQMKKKYPRGKDFKVWKK